MDRQISTVVIEWRAEIQLDQADGVLQFASLVLWANRAAIGDIDVPLTDVLWATKLDSMAG